MKRHLIFSLFCFATLLLQEIQGSVEKKYEWDMEKGKTMVIAYKIPCGGGDTFFKLVFPDKGWNLSSAKLEDKNGDGGDDFMIKDDSGRWNYWFSNCWKE